ncbi:hypothetical protein ACSYAD_18350 [Acaryochloris marina NIES-2412]|uniref:hypothetical protein n=1 Tax=Acaryochloris marina TaxID=155978 RepID=UPI00405A3524
MTANYWLFPALILAIVVILFLLRRVILTDRVEGQVLNEAKSKISSLTTQQEEWLANIQKTQEKLVMMFLALEETKKEAGLQSVGVSDKLRRASSAKKLLKNI